MQRSNDWGGSRGQESTAEDYEAELNEVFGPDEDFKPFKDKINEVRKIADDAIGLIKNNFPNRYFILKKIAQNPEFWEICTQKNYVVINEEAIEKKLKSCFEVIIFLYILFSRFLTTFIYFF